VHISEGVLSPSVLAGGAALAAAGVAVGLRRLDYDRLMMVAILAATFFVGSLVRVPVGIGNVHLILNGLLGFLLGWAVFPAIAAALALQALLFQYGGLTILGVNTFTMAFSGVLAGYCCKGIIALKPGALKLAAFCAGALGVALAGIFMAGALAFTDEGFVAAAKLLLLAHVPVMLAEGFITMVTVSFIARVRPELLSLSLKAARLPKSALLTATLLAILVSLPSEALSHRVNIFAWLEGDTVVTACDFGKNSPVKNGKITVYDLSGGSELLQGATDAEGRFRFPVPAAADGLRIRVNAGEGHQNEWRMEADEMSGTKPARPPETGPAARDIVGGIGWLVGLAGIALHIRDRRRRGHAGR